MKGDDNKKEFYSFVEKIVSQKGEYWFNTWSKSNPIANFHAHMSDDKLSGMILDPDVTHISLIDYAVMKEKLEFDVREE